MNEPSEIANILRQWIEAFTMRSMHEWRRYVKASGLSMPQFNLLMFLYHGGECGVRDIRERMEITSAAASQLVDRLVHSGLLERSEDPSDRRVRQIALSAEGRALVERSIAERYRWMDGLVVRLDAGRREAILKALSSLIEMEKELNLSEQFQEHLPGGRAAGKAPQRKGP